MKEVFVKIASILLPSRNIEMFLRIWLLSLVVWHANAVEKLGFTNEWAVQITGGMEMANEIARIHGFRNLGRVAPFDDIYKFVHVAVRRRHRRSAIFRTYNLNGDRRVLWTEQQVIKKRVKRYAVGYDDKRWKDQWYLYRREKGMKGHDMNVLPAWQQGITGKGVVVSILDDGIEYTHPELASNYDKDASYDYNSNDPDPKPMWTLRDTNGHGTRCAAEVAAVANNSQCIVGVAYNANIGGIRMLDGAVTDLVEAQSMSHQRNYIDVYSASWGPEDDGRTVDGPGNLTARVLEEGALKGRGGKGNIFVWASGNGGQQYDNCNCDGYTNSIYTISVSTATDSGAKPYYLEFCASSLISTYGNGHYGYDKQIVTADIHSGCTARHTGTSVAAPFIAGFVALALQAKPSLTWRDVQHLFVNTANTENLDSEDFQINGAGRKFSHHFGFGMVDGGALVNLAKKWHLVSKHHICKSKADKKLRILNNTRPLVRKIYTDGCRGTNSYVRYVEHVHVVVTLSHSMRGSVSIFIISPAGTRSQVLARRRKDGRRGNFRAWAFMSTHFWGEDPKGEWTIEISSGFKDRRIKIVENGFLEEWKLIFYGTKYEPGKPFTAEKSDKEAEAGAVETYCHHECMDGCTGSGPDQCISCRNFIFQNQTCVESCPEGYFTKMDESGRKVCHACHSICRFCSGKGMNECKACFGESVLTYGYCHQKCPAEHFWAAEHGSCQKCDLKCAACFGVSTNCTACPEGMIVRDGNCIKECKKGQYSDGKTCAPCDSSCESCTGPTDSDCTTCRVAKLFGLISFSDFFLLNGTCMTSCPNGYFADSLRCEKCAEHCGNCNGANIEDCNVCVDGYFKIVGLNKCVKKCPKGHFVNFELGLCEPCAHACEECVPGKAEACLSCSKRSFLQDGRCVFANECDFGFYANYTTKKCQVCPYPCAACTDPTTCTSCALNLYMNVDGSCVERCPFSSYLNDTFAKCVWCHPECLECSGPTRNNCIACRRGKFLLNGRCVSLCPKKGYYTNHSSRACLPCYHSCAECRGPRPNQCKKCIKNLDLRLSSCYPPCIDKYLSENSCKPCDSTCRSCFGPTRFDCLSCPAKLLLNPATYSCTKTCPAGYFKPPKLMECKKCHPPCGSCTGDSPNDCLTCVGTLTYFNGSCTTHCPAGYYISKDNVCKPCQKECRSCLYKPDFCTTCNEGYVLNDDYECKKTCNGKYFLVKDLNRCFECHQNCRSCTGFGVDECTSCSHGLYLWKNMCLFSCPPGFVALDGKCVSCDPHCAQCEGPSKCMVCQDQYLLHKGSCVLTCPDSFVSENGFCFPCHHSCQHCFSADEKSCLTCKPGLVKSPMGTCHKRCPSGTFLSSVEGLCEYCHNFCNECKGEGMHNCTSCAKGLLLHEETMSCVHSCPSWYYVMNNTCKACHKSCKTCKGGGERNCTKCRRPHLLHQGSCVELCPAGTFVQRLGGWRRCSLCHKHCLHCSGFGDSKCLKCTNTSVSHLGRCLSECPPGFYPEENSRECKLCSRNCLTCTSKVDSCRSCLKPYKVEAGKCVLPCEFHFYYNTSSDQCQECDATCQSCSSNGKHNCTSCPPHSVLRHGRCKIVCKHGQYETKGTCRPCHEKCTNCSGPNVTDCYGCKNNMVLTEGICHQPCEEGFVFDTRRDSCKPCKSLCLECSPDDLTCRRCMSGSRIEEGRCLPNCTTGFYLDLLHQSCIRCPNSCADCLGPRGEICKVCKPLYVLHMHRCFKSCPSGWYQHHKRCRRCSGNCNSCTDVSKCEKCTIGYLLHDGKCLSTCPSFHFADRKSGHCKSCPLGCKNCNGSSERHCTECSQPFYWELGRCVTNCSEGFHANISAVSKVCIPVDYRRGTSTDAPCIKKCKEGQFFNSSLCACLACNNNCRKCNSSHACSECVEGFLLVNGSCIEASDAAFDTEISGSSVIPCPEGCVDCSADGSCNICENELILTKGICLPNCSEGYFPMEEGFECHLCPEKCRVCRNADNCAMCQPGYYLQDGACVASCSDGYYKSSTSNICVRCHPNCRVCMSKEDGFCITCKPSYWFYDGSCLTDCSIKEGVFKNSSTMECAKCSTDCIACYNSSMCTKCSNATYLEEGGCTAECSPNYRLDPISNTCIICDGTCEPLKPNLRSLKCFQSEADSLPSSTQHSTVFILTLSLFCILLSSFGAILWRKHRHSRNIPLAGHYSNRVPTDNS